MMLAWMVYAMLAAAALGVAAWLVDFAVAGRFVRRRVLWAGVFLASSVGPIVFSVTRGIATAEVAAEEVGAAPAASERKEAIVSDRVLKSAWLGASAVVALWLVATQRRLRRRVRVYPSRIVDGEPVLVSSDFGPAVVGIVRPQIVLPAWALTMRESDRRIIVAHETEHRHARDPLLSTFALIVVAALPWNAALWWQLRRLRLAIEIDCDRRVVARSGYDPHAYGMLLLATRERASRVTPAMAMAMASMRSGLGRRVEALLDGRPRSAVRRLSALAAAGVLTMQIASVPAPRLSVVRAAVVDTSAALSPTLPQPALTVARSDSAQTRSVRPMKPPAVTPPRDVQTGNTQGSDYVPSDSASTVEPRWVTESAAPEHRVVRTASSTRWFLLPGEDPVSRRLVRNAAGDRAILVRNPEGTRAILLPSPDSLRHSPR